MAEAVQPAVADRVTWCEQLDRLLFGCGVGELVEDGDVVEDPEGAAVGADDEVALGEDHVVDGDDGEVAAEALPGGAVVGGKVDAGLGAGVEEAFAGGVFADDPGEVVGGDAACDLGPGGAKVGGLEEVGGEVVELVAGSGQVGGAGVVG